MRAHHFGAFALVLALAACAGDAPAPIVDGPEVAILTSPISYPGIDRVCFALEVFNGQPGPGTDTVWSKDGICSDAFGSGEGGAISYVGPCDASVDGDNYVALTLESIRVAGGQTLDDQTGSGPGYDGADFQNPCTAADRCYLHFKCEANKDVHVEFNLTVMRDANQGFFDIGVAFDDIFCAAKVDTCTAPDAPIRLLYGDDIADPVGADRTAVAAVACTAGPDGFEHDFDTHLLFTSKVVQCTDGNGDAVSFTLNAVDEDEGQREATSGGYTLRYANYFGAEQLECGGYLTMNEDGDLLFECGGPELCRISGAGVDNEWGGYGFSQQAQGSQGAYGGYGGYGYGAQGSQGSARSSLGYGGAYVYVSDAATRSQPMGPYGPGSQYRSGGSSLTYYDGNGDEITPTLVDGKVPGWEPVITKTSCNKTYYNTAIDVENLAGQGLADCSISFQATALASDDTADFDASTGTFAQAGGMYGAVNVPGVPLTGALVGDAVTAVCDANPLDGDNLAGDDSLVHTHYIGDLVGEQPAFCFHSDDGGVLQQFAGCGDLPPGCEAPYIMDENGACVLPNECPIGCTACQPWAATMVCAQEGDVYACTIDGAPASTDVYVGPSSDAGGATVGTTNSDGHVVIVMPDGEGDYYALIRIDDGDGGFTVAYIYRSEPQCTACGPGRHLDNAGRCVSNGGGRA